MAVDGNKPQTKPWYMAGGEVRPVLSNVSGRVSLYPEEAPGQDRITSQINFIPPDTPENQDSSELPLKKVLFWTGANGWGIKPGRGVFLKEQCPVSTCVISTKRRDSAHADLIIFKDHFIMPSFDRPKKQLWMIFMLGNSGMHFNQEPIIILICPDFRVPTEHPAVQEAVSFQLDRNLQIRLDCGDAL